MVFYGFYYILDIKMWKTKQYFMLFNTLNIVLIHNVLNVWKSLFNRLISRDSHIIKY